MKYVNRLQRNLLLTVTLTGLALGCTPGVADTKPNANTASGTRGDLPISTETEVTTVRRIVSVGGGNTEIVFALGAGKEVVGVDTSSLYPNDAVESPKVGYQRTLSAEGVLSLSPSILVYSDSAGPPAVLTQLRESGLELLQLSSDTNLDAVRTRIETLAKAFGRETEGRALIETLNADLNVAKQLQSELTSKPRVMFIYARGAGTANVGGTHNAAHEMIYLAAAQNAVTQYEGFRPLTSEAVVTAAPDVILLPARGLESLGGIDAVLKLPGVSETPAGKQKRIVGMDDLMLLGFGPRTGKAVQQLTSLVHENIPSPAVVLSATH